MSGHCNHPIHDGWIEIDPDGNTHYPNHEPEPVVQDTMQRAFHELMRPRYIVAAFILGMVLGWIFMPQPALASEPGPEQRPHQLAINYDERIAFPHDGPHCWRFNQNRNGRWRAVIVDGVRASRGAPCRGPVIARVRLPWGVQEDNVRVFSANDHVYVFALRHD